MLLNIYLVSNSSSSTSSTSTSTSVCTCLRVASRRGATH
eukprot:COSAG03_NODE_18420_length_355_cov_1.003906_1_plen_38_part_10